MTHGSLFSGIGGFDLAAEWMGWENKFHCEWNEFGQKVLKHYWPNAESFNDITKTNFTKYANRIDILTGGFPCQPYSLAGKRKGKEDERHLWPEMLRAIREIQPRWVVGENVFGLINWSNGLVFHEVQADLEAAGYEVWPYVLPAVSVNAPHRRDRIWFVAHSINNRHKTERRTTSKENRISGIYRPSMDSGKFNGTSISPNATKPHSNGQHWSNSKHEVNPGEGRKYAQRDIEQMGGNVADGPGSSSQGELQQRQGKGEFGRHDSEMRERDVTNTERIGSSGQEYWIEKPGQPTKTYSGSRWSNFPTQSPICSGNDGLSTELDGITFPKWRNESIKAAGNAIVPQIALMIFKTIEQYEQL